MDKQPQLNKGSRKIIQEELSKIAASDIMIPRTHVILINNNTSFLDIVDIVINDGHSRFPVYSEKIDNIVGILYVKDLLQYFKKIETEFNITKILRKPLFVSENKKCNDLITAFREERVHIAIVVDEYGTMLGIVTLEDILEEIVGDISDEYDAVEDEKNNIIAINPDEMIILSKMSIEEFNNIYKTKFKSDIYETIGGLIMDKFGYIPIEGESIHFGNLNFTIKSVEGSRIRQIIVKKG